MNQKILVIMILGGMLSLGCSSTVVADHHNCANLPGMKLTIKEYHIDLNDNRPVCVTVPGTFKITIHNPNGSGVTVNLGDVTVGQKDDSANPADPDVEINGDNLLEVDKLTVVLEGEADPGDDLEFWISIAGVGKLDPKVRIIESAQQERMQYDAVDETMDAWGLEFDDALKLRPLEKTE